MSDRPWIVEFSFLRSAMWVPSAVFGSYTHPDNARENITQRHRHTRNLVYRVRNRDTDEVIEIEERPRA